MITDPSVRHLEHLEQHFKIKTLKSWCWLVMLKHLWCGKHKEYRNFTLTKYADTSYFVTNRGIGVRQVQKRVTVTKEVINYTTRYAIEQANIKYLPELFLCADNTPLQYVSLLDHFFTPVIPLLVMK